MNSYSRFLLCRALMIVHGCLCALGASAATRYVWQSSPSPTPPHNTWATAAHTIQQAVDAAETGDTVLVVGGIYSTGGRATGSWGLTNRVTLDKAITVQSLMGPEVTVIAGAGGAEGEAIARGVYVGDGAVLSGFTIRDGRTLTNPYYWEEGTGGGIWSEWYGVVSNCVITGNSASWGGGVYGGFVSNCVITGNSASWGGGVYGGNLFHCVVADNSAIDDGGGANNSTLQNCSVTGNRAAMGGGTFTSTLRNCAVTRNRAGNEGGGSYGGAHYNCTVTGNTAGELGGGVVYGPLANCLVYYNDAPTAANHNQIETYYTCTTPLPPGGAGNISDEPALASATHLSSLSPCIGAGYDGYAVGVDLDGEPWLSPPCIGADQMDWGGAISALSVEIAADHTEVVPGFVVSFQALIEGQTTRSEWDFGDGTTLTNRPLAVSHAWTTAGAYPVRLTAYNDAHPEGISVTLVVQVVELPVFYVNQANPTPLFPYQTWETAATNIQDAIGAGRTAGRWIWVTNGVYSVGGVAAAGSLLTNRVALTNAVTLRSVQGPLVTVIAGAAAPGNTNGDSAVRCAWVGKGSVLDGFTLTNGHTRVGVETGTEQSGAGVWGEGNPVVTNCVLAGNWAARDGGGADSATLYDCLIVGNLAGDDAGGVDQCTLYDCTLTGNTALQNGGAADQSILHRCTLRGNSALEGGGVDDSTLFHCTLVDNVSSRGAGGASESVLRNCVLTGNTTRGLGGGARDSLLYNCTVTGNTAAERGGGVDGGSLYNCISYYNRAPTGPNYYSAYCAYSCTTPLPTSGQGNIEDEPQLASSSHLSPSSPCIGAGLDSYAEGVDIDGEAWLSPPCLGADQVVLGSAVSALSVGIQADQLVVVPGFVVTLQAIIEGQATSSQWDFADGTVVLNRPVDSRHAWAEVGSYTVRLRVFNDAYPGGVSATVQIQVVELPVFYVNQANHAPAVPYQSWATAAVTIQDALGAGEVAGRLVWVTNGVYEVGEIAQPGDPIANRVALTNPVTVRSVNGPLATVLRGALPDTNGEGAVRCAWVGNGAVLDGFTLTNGHTPGSWTPGYKNQGGGAWCEAEGVLTNCILRGNSAYLGGAVYSGRIHSSVLASNTAYMGGGSYRSTLYGCTLAGNVASQNGGGALESMLHLCELTNNRAYRGGGAAASTLLDSILVQNISSHDGGGAYKSTLSNSTLRSNAGYRGAGAYSSTLSHCRLTSNSASHDGGGTDRSTLYNCVLTGNWAADDGGGTDESALYNCTVVSNSAHDIGGGTSESSLYNSIVLFNTASAGANYGSYGAIEHCCTRPLPFTGTGNKTNDPAFLNLAAGDFRLRYGSPCIDAGSNLNNQVTTDFEGHPRPLDGDWNGTAAFDIGAFEYDPQTADSSSDGIPDFWCRQFGFDPNDPSVAGQNPDQDSYDNRDEWTADTDPTDPNSWFHLAAISNLPPVTVYFQSSANRTYSLLFSADPAGPAWTDLPGQANIPGQGTLQGLIDTNAVGIRFYRVRVAAP